MPKPTTTHKRDTPSTGSTACYLDLANNKRNIKHSGFTKTPVQYLFKLHFQLLKLGAILDGALEIRAVPDYKSIENSRIALFSFPWVNHASSVPISEVLNVISLHS